MIRTPQKKFFVGPTQVKAVQEFIGADKDGSYCKRCNQRFLNHQRLLYHLKRVCGKGKLKFVDPDSPGYCVCHYCGEEFSTKSRRRYHMATHCTEKTARGKEPVDRNAPGYCVCPHCGEEFSSKGKRKYHVMRLCTKRGQGKTEPPGKRKTKARKVWSQGERSGAGVKQEGMTHAVGDPASCLEKNVPPVVRYL